MKNSKKKFDVAQMVTDKIIGLMEQGVCPWNRPWKLGDTPKNLITKNPYKGINKWLLRAMADFMNYEHNFWLTAKQAIDLGGHVIKGEKSTPVVFWSITYKVGEKWYTPTQLRKAGLSESDADKKSFTLKYFNVFNVAQCEKVSHRIPENTETTEIGSIEELDRIEQNWKDIPPISFGGDQAYYVPSTDSIKLPQPENFNGTNEYYATKWHELGHATGHKQRLNRKEINEPNFFGSHGYSCEELVAELFASSMMSIGGITQTIKNSASYIKSWMQRLKDDKDLLINAAGRAQKAIDYVTKGGK